MNEPPDPGGSFPGLSNPPSPACNVTIEPEFQTPCSVNIPKRKHKHSGKHKSNCSKIKSRSRSRSRSNSKRSACSSSEDSSTSIDIPPPKKILHTIPVQNYAPTQLSQPTVGRLNYESNDTGPYIVHIQREETNSNAGTTIHPVSVGYFLQKNGIINIIDGSLKKIGRNRISATFSSAQHANNFLSCPALLTNGYKAFIPSYNITKMGLVRGVPPDWTPEELVSQIRIPDNYKTSILKVRRLNFKTTVDGISEWKPSQTVVLTFDGQTLPDRIFVCYNSLPVELYIYPTIQCFNCCRFGHTKVQCRSRPRCFKCGHGHPGESCSVDESQASCISCNGFHFATNRAICPEHHRQKQIKTSMAEKSISYTEAVKIHTLPVKHSYARVLAPINPNIKNKEPPQTNLNPESHSPKHSQSYKKMYFQTPRPSPIPYTRGYDRISHDAFTRNPPSQLPNGCAIKNSINNPPSTKSLSREEMMSELIQTIITLISPFLQNAEIKQHNPAPQPSNAADFIPLSSKLVRNAPCFETYPMELPKY